MLIREILAFISLGLASLFILFTCVIPSLLYIVYFVQISEVSNIILFLFKIFYYVIIIISINMASFLFIPPMIFRIFKIMPREGEYDLTPLNKEVYKWYLSLSLYKTSMIIGRISHITRGLVIRLFGGKVGRDVYFQGHVTEPYFLEIGDYTVVGDQAKIFTHIADKPGKILFGRVKIGKNCLIGYGALVMPRSKIKDYVIIGAYSIVPKGSVLDKGIWVGSSARKIRDLNPEEIKIVRPEQEFIPIRFLKQRIFQRKTKQTVSSEFT